MNKTAVHIFHTGRVRVDRAIPLRERNPLALTGFFRGKSKQMLLPVSAYLITHDGKNILIDTGWDTKYAFEKPRQMCGMVDKISHPDITSDEGIDSKLASLGLKPADIDGVFISHMDFDHVSGLRLVRDAKHIYTAAEEWEACNRPSLRYVDAWSGVCKVETFEYRRTGAGPFGRSYDVFGDGAVQLVSTTGHSKGHFSVMITGDDGYIVLGGDAAYLPESFERRIIPGFAVDKAAAVKSLEWLISCRNDPNCKGVFVNHDSTVKEQTLEV